MPLNITLRRWSLMVAESTIALLLISTATFAKAQSSAKIDQFGTVNAEDAMARLDRFALELKTHPESRGIIVASNTVAPGRPRGTFLRLANGYRNYLVKSRGVEDSRISVAEGERKREIRFELWRLPSNELSTISEEASAAEPSQPELFDEIPVGPEAQCVSQLPIALYKLEDGLRILGEALRNHFRAKVWIVVHPRTQDSQIATRRLVNRSRQLLISNGVRAERILTAVSSSRSPVCGSVNMWIVPAGSAKADEAAYYSQLLDDAESNEYTLRRIEFIGNEHLRDNVLRKEFQPEGDRFSRKILDESLKNFSGLGLVYPVTLEDVVARIDREEKLVNLTIFFRERRRR